MTSPLATEISPQPFAAVQACLVADDDTLPQWPEVSQAATSESVRWQRVSGGLDQACSHALSHPTDLLVIAISSPNASQWQQLGSILNSRPSMRVVLLTRDESAQMLRHALRAGVREVLGLPVSSAALDRVCQEQLQQLRIQATPQAHRSRVMALVGAKGGCGVTFLATSLAHAISLRGVEVAVLDLHAGSGDAAWYLSDTAATTGLLELSHQLHRLDTALLEASLIDCAPHLRLLPGSAENSPEEKPTAEAVSRVLSLMRARFGTTVVDLPTSWEEAPQEAAHQADSVFLVVNNHLADLRAAQRWLQRAHNLPDLRSRLSLVVNHVHPHSAISTETVRQTLHFERAREIPHSPRAVTYATNHGMPLLTHSRSDPVAKALAQWSREWVGQPHKRSWWPWARGQESKWLTVQPA